ncbi:MAG: glycosyltransferase family 39 protein [bacterium]|nr:glycosyltransferase family 39 protein [Candidatus Sumerlaeota bacterium]
MNDSVIDAPAQNQQDALNTQQPPRMASGYFVNPMRMADVFIALLSILTAFGAVTLSYKGYGHSWDEALYYKGAIAAAKWLIGTINGDTWFTSSAGISGGWGDIPGTADPLHPEVAPAPKMLTGLGAELLVKRGSSTMTAMRLPVAAVFALTVGLITIMAMREYGRLGGILAAISYLLMPRVFGHAHIAASETLLAFATLAVVWAFLAGIRHAWLALFTAIAFALAVDTKFSAILLPLPLILWGHIYFRRKYVSNVFAMLFLAPIIAVAAWPFLWTDGVRKLGQYIAFYLAHPNPAVYYMGLQWGQWGKLAAPWHYPFVITAFSLPEWVLLFALAGMLRSLGQMLSRPVQMLFLLMAVFWIGMCALPGAPKYDGERLFFPAFVFIALLAGGGAAGICHLYGQGYRARLATTITVLVITLWGATDLIMSHPNGLNFFNRLIGGPRGAYEAGYETSYWGEALNEDVISFLKEHTRPGMKIKPLVLNEQVFANLVEWGQLSPDVDWTTRDLPPYDMHILQVRQGFFGRAERALHFSRAPLMEFKAQGVPRIQIFAGDALTSSSFQHVYADESATTPAASAQTEVTSATTGNAEEQQTSAPGTRIEALPTSDTAEATRTQ